MGKKMEWDEFEDEWHKAAVYPKRYESRAMRFLSSADVERDDKLNELLDREFGLGTFIPSPKMFKEAS